MALDSRQRETSLSTSSIKMMGSEMATTASHSSLFKGTIEKRLYNGIGISTDWLGWRGRLTEKKGT